MKKLLLLSLFISVFQNVNAQKIHLAIDSAKHSISEKIIFIRDYFRQDNATMKEYWLPKYSSSKRYNFSTLIDGITRHMSPKKIIDRFDVEITEIQELNDSLSYFKFALSSPSDNHLVEYKYYLVKRGENYYIDNCKDYEKYRFTKVETPNISFYISPWTEIDNIDLFKAGKTLDSLVKKLNPAKETPHIESFLCSSLEEVNILVNMTHFYGYVGGFTEMEHNFIVSHNAPPTYLHEFIHIILGTTGSNSSFFLGEGIASYLGGLAHNYSYKYGLEYLKNCFDNGRCTFDLLYEKKIVNPKDSIPTYAFAAAICDFILTNYGYDYFRSLYYNPDVTDKNLIEKICNDKGIKRIYFVNAIRAIINTD